MTADPAPGASHVPASPVPYGSAAFEQVLASVGGVRTGRQGMSLVLLEASREDKQEVVGRVAEEASLDIHQYNLGRLLGKRFVETQGNLREAFDRASEEAALLFFDRTDALFAAQDGGGPGGEPVPVDYFFQRVSAFKGVVMLCLDDSRYLERIRAHDVDVTITF